LKHCGTCGLDKPPSEFNKSVREPDGHQSRCRTCQADYYATNRDRYLPGLQERRRRQVALLSRYAWDHLLTHPCVDCGEPDPMVLDFDHVSGIKVMGISRMVANGGSLEALQEEIAKCVSRCANCHRRKTARERGYYAWLTAAPSSSWSDPSLQGGGDGPEPSRATRFPSRARFLPAVPRAGAPVVLNGPIPG
jgi:hypothetical protein